MARKTFSLEEVDTTIYDCFVSACAKGEFDLAASIAKVIIDNSKNDQIKRSVRDKFTRLTVNRYSYLLDGDGDGGLQGVHSKLMKLYVNRANKKLDISEDIPEFSEMASRYVTEKNTLLHYDRLYTLYQSILNVFEINGDIVELGVYRGGSLKFICELLERHSISKRLIGFDTFSGHLETDELDGAIHKSGMFSGTSLSQVTSYVNNVRAVLIEGDASVTFKEYASSSKGISLAHIDMDLYKPTADTLPLAYELLAPKGIILLDDYGFTSCPGVKKAVDDFLKINPVTHYHLMTGQMIVVK